MHGNADRITRPQDTWAYAERARPLADVMAIEIRNGDHPLLRRAGLWHSIAAEFACSVFGVPGRTGQVAEILRSPACDPRRVTL